MVQRCRRPLLFLAALLLVPTFAAHGQAADRQAVERSHAMLLQAKQDLLRYYYDSTFGGFDIEARYRVADSTLNTVATVPELYGIIAQFLMDLKDSHTNFLPPRRAATVAYGWSWTMIGDACFVRSVQRDSDAEKKGLAPGDQVLAIDGMAPNRESIRIISYLYNALNPRPGMHLQVQKPDGTRLAVDVLAKVTPAQRVFDWTSFQDVGRLINQYEDAATARRHWWRSFGDSVLVWHFLSFRYRDEGIDEMMDRARQHRTLILDLRNNGGGSEWAILRLIGHFFDRDVRIGIVRRRNERQPLVAAPSRRTPFTGNLIILINWGSASASEVTARFLQLEGRATVVGDRSRGAVLGANTLSHAAGFQKFQEYGVQVSVMDLVMPDEGRLENIGVMPEFLVLPTGADLLGKRDPQMAKALQLAGIQMTPSEAALVLQPSRRP